MGTRNLSILKKDGEYKVRQYGQWDGYLEGQGMTILEFCRKEGNLKALREIADDLRDIRNKEMNAFCELYDSLAPQWSNQPDKRTTEMRYWFEKLCSRDIGGEIFENIITVDKSKLPKEMDGHIYLMHYSDWDKLINYSDIWIEYAYIIDLDTNKLEVWSYGEQLGEFDLDNLPSDDEFLALENGINDDEQ